MRFAESKDVVANETVEPIDVIFKQYMQEVEHERTLRSIEGHRSDIAETKERNL